MQDFYKHPAMADGHLNKCKDCTKKDVRLNVAVRFEQYSAYERNRNKTPRRIAHITKTSQRWRKDHPDRYLAHNLVNNAIRSGKLISLGCYICGKKAHAHHDDYSKPLEVIWACPKHHRERHKGLDRLRTTEI